MRSERSSDVTSKKFDQLRAILSFKKPAMSIVHADVKYNKGQEGFFDLLKTGIS